MDGARGQQRLLAATDDIEEAQATYSASVSRVVLEQRDRRESFRWRSVTVDLGPVVISTEEFGAAFFASSKDSPDVYTMTLASSSVSGETTFGGATQSIKRGDSTYVYSASGDASFTFDTGFRGLQIMIRPEEVHATLSALLGTTLSVPCRFQPRLALDRGVGPALERAADYALSETELDDGLFSTPIAAQRFGEALVMKLLHGQPHNYSDRLAKTERSAGPRAVRVAAEYLNANLTRPVRLAELAAVAGVSVRALQIGFQKHRGCTPLEFLRDRRLALSRSLLLEGRARGSVAEVAKECGFAHLGRFSAQYRARFGELPGETRAQAR